LLGIFAAISKGNLAENFEVTQLTKEFEQSAALACASAGAGKRKILKLIMREKIAFIEQKKA
jgi:hypothetical protein